MLSSGRGLPSCFGPTVRLALAAMVRTWTPAASTLSARSAVEEISSAIGPPSWSMPPGVLKKQTERMLVRMAKFTVLRDEPVIPVKVEPSTPTATQPPRLLDRYGTTRIAGLQGRRELHMPRIVFDADQSIDVAGRHLTASDEEAGKRESECDDVPYRGATGLPEAVKGP